MPPFDQLNDREKTETHKGFCARCEQSIHNFCSGLPLEETQHLESILSQIQYETHSTIFREGDAAQNLYSVGSGAVKLYKLLPDGRRQITAFLFRGNFFGLSNNGSYSYTAEAMTPVSLCRFPKKKLDELFESHPKLEKRMLEATTGELVAAQDQFLMLGRKTAREKVATFLVNLCVRLAPEHETLQNLTLPMNRSDIADFLGLTIETVSRTLTVMKRDKLISLPDANHVIIELPDALAHIAEGS